MTVPEEQIVLVDARGQRRLTAEGETVTLGKTEAHRQGVLHLAVSVFVFNARNELLLQQRARHKYHSPGCWSNTCCTHPRADETPAACAARRLTEEMGLHCPLVELFQFTYRAEVGNGLVENEYDHVFTGRCDDEPKPDPAEVGGWKWIAIADLQHDLTACPDQYTYWLKYCFAELLRRRGGRLQE